MASFRWEHTCRDAHQRTCPVTRQRFFFFFVEEAASRYFSLRNSFLGVREGQQRSDGRGRSGIAHHGIASEPPFSGALLGSLSCLRSGVVASIWPRSRCHFWRGSVSLSNCTGEGGEEAGEEEGGKAKEKGRRKAIPFALPVLSMAEICCGVVSESEANPTCKPSSRAAARRRRTEIRRFKFVGGGGVGGVARPRGGETASGLKRRKLLDAGEGFCSDDEKRDGGLGDGRLERKAASISDDSLSLIRATATMATAALSRTQSSPAALELPREYPKFGVSSVCGRRREMEDMVAVHPSFCRRRGEPTTELHYFGVYDGHGCSHVAVRCRERMHELIKEELAAANNVEGSAPTEWRAAMERSFRKMDEEAIAWSEGAAAAAAAAAAHERCRCELQSPECEAVGSTAVVAIVTPDKIVVANCGDSRAVLSRKGKAVPLSSDHRPDRPDELNRIQEAGGRVIYWGGGPRVLGVLAMSRAIGDNYLKPYVSCDPEVTVMERTADDDCLILATDGLWDVVSNDSACGVASMCLRGKIPVPPEDAAAAASEPTAAGMGRARPDRACSDTSLLLTKLALARHSTDNVSVVVVDLRRSW